MIVLPYWQRQLLGSYMQDLDTASAVPAAAVLALGSIDGSAASMAGDPVDSEQSRHEPKKSGQERKGNVGLELAALVSGDGVDVVPVEDVAAGAIQHLQRESQLLSSVVLDHI